MSLRNIVTIGLLTSLVLVGCDNDNKSKSKSNNDSGGGGSLLANCQKVCSFTDPLNCPNAPDNCVNHCQLRATADGKCRSLVEAQMACSAARPASDFLCDPDTGQPDLKETACASQTNALVACLTE